MSQLVLFLELATIAILFAGLPLAYLWTRPGYSFFTKLNWVLVFMTFDLIVFGAFTRLTDSGLGCPDWPGCYGTSNPWHAIGDIQMAQAALPEGPVTVIKAWIEMKTPQKPYGSSFPDKNESFHTIDFLAHLAEAGSKDFSTSKVQPL